MNGIDLAAMAAFVALAWLLFRWSGRLDRYEDEIERRDRERREQLRRDRPYDWFEDDDAPA